MDQGSSARRILLPLSIAAGLSGLACPASAGSGCDDESESYMLWYPTREDAEIDIRSFCNGAGGYGYAYTWGTDIRVPPDGGEDGYDDWDWDWDWDGFPKTVVQAVVLEELELPELAAIALELLGVFGDAGDALSLQAMIEKYDSMGDGQGVTVVHYREQTTWSITNTFTLTLAGGDDAGTAIGSWNKTVPTGNL